MKSDEELRKEPEEPIVLPPPKPQEEDPDIDKEFLLIHNEKEGMKIHLISQTCSMTDLINYAYNIQYNFFNKKNNNERGYTG